MAVYGMQVTKSFKAAIDLSSYQYCFVRTGSVAGEVTTMAVINSSTLGVLQNDPKATEEALVCLFGLTKIRADADGGGSPLLIGGYLKSGSSGCAIGTVPLASASINFAGVSLEAVATGSAYVEMFLRPQLMLPNV